MDRNKTVDIIYDFAKDVRKMALDMAISSGRNGAHIGGSFSSIEILSVLYGAILNYDIKNPEWEERDRFIPSKTHCILAHFPALARAGFIEEKDLNSFHDDGGMLAGHPWNKQIGLEFAGGSLGMGLSVGIGMALRAKRYNKSPKVYVLLGDGESNEGSVWEAVMSAAQYGLDNLVAIFDYNNMQFDGPNDNIMSLSPLSEKLKAFGWKALDVNGHSIEELLDAFDTKHSGQPLAIIAHTVKARGIPSLENQAKSHHSSLSREDYDLVMKDISEGKYDRVQ